ncbi:hypothetical protein E2C01_043775 [Portunus trituberculatus]|uniref:Uncharacterized protein n=1 Tax=Portunus trituberculatus TaxID=210409 RepID=A0A5B7FQC8_PORTR|nr:hypothetical protein [Portunus trituberculatus]
MHKLRTVVSFSPAWHGVFRPLRALQGSTRLLAVSQQPGTVSVTTFLHSLLLKVYFSVSGSC